MSVQEWRDFEQDDDSDFQEILIMYNERVRMKELDWDKLRRVATILGHKVPITDEDTGMNRPPRESDFFDLSTDGEVLPHFNVDTSEEGRQRADDIWARIDAAKNDQDDGRK